MDVNAEITTGRGGHRILLNVEGTEIETPPVEHLAFYAGLAALAGTGIVPWPIAITLGVGHVILDITRRPGLDELGEALEAA